MEFLAAYALFYIAVYGTGWFFIRVVPVLGDWLYELLRALFIAIFFVINLVAMLLLRTLKFVCRYARLGLIFIGFVIMEWVKGPDEEDAQEGDDEYYEEQNEREPEQPRVDPYLASLKLFGLKPGFSRNAFDKAYKQAIRKAHPDLGGSTRDAQIVNAAREIIVRRHGWA